MILPPTSEISHHHKVKKITMPPTSLSPDIFQKTVLFKIVIRIIKLFEAFSFGSEYIHRVRIQMVLQGVVELHLCKSLLSSQPD